MSQPGQECLCCKALWIEFVLCEDLTCTTSGACARVHDFWQGELDDSCPDGDTSCNGPCADTGLPSQPALFVYNQKSRLAGGSPPYIFAGEKGDMGIACYDDIEDKYRIVAMGKRLLIPFELKQDETLLPGTSAEALVLKLNNGQWIATAIAIDVHDSFHRNCFFAGERGWARFECGRYEIVGENGLERAAKAYEDIECDTAGDIDLYSEPDTCEPAVARARVEACNVWGWRRKLNAEEKLHVRWMPDLRRWIIRPHPRAQLYKAQIAAEALEVSCADPRLPVMAPVALDYCDPDIAEVIQAKGGPLNFASLAGSAGDNVFFVYDQGEDDYLAIQIQHKEAAPVINVRNQDCEIEQQVQKMCVAMAKPPEWEETDIETDNTDVVVAFQKNTGSPGQPECKVEYRRVKICTIGEVLPTDPTEWQTLLEFESQWVTEYVQGWEGGVHSFDVQIWQPKGCNRERDDHPILEATDECPEDQSPGQEPDPSEPEEDPCPEQWCTWEWNGQSWDKISDGCAEDCLCLAPQFPGPFIGAQSTTKCQGWV